MKARSMKVDLSMKAKSDQNLVIHHYGFVQGLGFLWFPRLWDVVDCSSQLVEGTCKPCHPCFET